MALDKLVDSGQLNGALLATANAIREKTGSSDTITWDMDTGFADDIADIQSGSVIITDTTDSHGGVMRHISTSGNTLTGKSSDDITVSGDTLTVPAGIYAISATKTFPAGSAATPATSITANPAITVSNSGLITATVSASESVTPNVSSGYITSGTAGTITVSGSDTNQLATATATLSGTNTITPSASMSGNGCTLSDTDNGISITATGGGSASASVTATTDTAGYAAANDTLGSDTFAATLYAAQTKYISGVTITAPASGTRAFSITVPNGAGTATFVFTVDSSGNVAVTES